MTATALTLIRFSIALDFLLQQLQYPQKTVILSDIPFVKDESAYSQIVEMLSEKKYTA